VHLIRRVSLASGRGVGLGDLVDRLAEVHGDRLLVDQAGDRPFTLTYRQAAGRVAVWSGAVAAKAGPGDRIVLATPNGYDLLLLCVAAARAGAVPVPVNPQMSTAEVDHVIEDSGAVLVVRDPADLEGGDPLDRPHRPDPGDVAAIFYTSGTTGAPKGVELTHAGLVGQVSASALWPSRARRDEALVALPVAHIMGFAALLGMACAGIPVHFLPRFRPLDVLDAIEARRSTIFVGVPAMYRMMLEAGAEGRDLRSVRVWASGSDVMPADLARRFKRMGASVTLPLLGASVGEAAFVEGYGMVEVAGGVAAKVSPPGWDVGLGDSLGVTLPGYRFRVVGEDGREVLPGAVGELLIKGPGLLRGYHGDPDATAAALTEDGWLRTGDLARRGPRGLVAFAGRKKDVIKHGGYSVYASEVERALEEHPDVVQAAVVGLPDERTGEVPAAAVELRKGSTLTGDGLIAWAASRLSDYKRPRRVLIVDELPRTGTRKVQKDGVLALFT
jgi:long-chain acyl-CoA synthetase